MAAHSNVVGGSTAKRVINCPGSVKLVAQSPKKTAGAAADEGTLCHLAMELILLDKVKHPTEVIGLQFNGITLTEDLYTDLIVPALGAWDIIDPNHDVEFVVEQEVGFGDIIPGAFGTADILGRRGNTAIVGDYKFGYDPVSAVELDQGLYYTAAAMHTPGLEWMFEGVDEVEIIIIQPKVSAEPSRWTTSIDRVKRFERDLITALHLSEKADAPLNEGSWCKWCAAKAMCPKMNGEIERALQSSLLKIDGAVLADFLVKADLAEAWAKSVRELSLTLLEAGKPIPGKKLVAKRAIRKWKDELVTVRSMHSLGLCNEDLYDTSIKSPAQLEKVLKSKKLELPADLVSAVSSGNTIADADDPRPAVNLLGNQLTSALSKLGV